MSDLINRGSNQLISMHFQIRYDIRYSGGEVLHLKGLLPTAIRSQKMEVKIGYKEDTTKKRQIS